MPFKGLNIKLVTGSELLLHLFNALSKHVEVRNFSIMNFWRRLLWCLSMKELTPNTVRTVEVLSEGFALASLILCRNVSLLLKFMLSVSKRTLIAKLALFVKLPVFADLSLVLLLVRWHFRIVLLDICIKWILGFNVRIVAGKCFICS